MNMVDSRISFACPNCDGSLTCNGKAYSCKRGHVFPIVRGIPRFVTTDHYANSFGLQWNTFRKTQLDSYTGAPISRARLERIFGPSFASLAGKTVLEAGCGAGRFTEVLLAAGATVFATDLSSAVEANKANCGDSPNYFVAQADIRNFPFFPGQFDVVMCIGVIQHTPNSEETINELSKYVKPGGLLIIDHYRVGYHENISRKAMRSVLLNIPPQAAMQACSVTMAMLWPIHRASWRLRKIKGFGRLNHWLRRNSPLVDYQGRFPDLSEGDIHAWSLLDTHDLLTDHFKHLRDVPQIEAALKQAGLEAIECWYGGNGVEARARKPTRKAST